MKTHKTTKTLTYIVGLILLAVISCLVYGATISESELTHLLPPWAVRNVRIASVFFTGAAVGSALTLIVRARCDSAGRSTPGGDNQMA